MADGRHHRLRRRGGREGRSEFHVDPSDEVMYMIKGDMNLHYRTPEGEEKVV